MGPMNIETPFIYCYTLFDKYCYFDDLFSKEI